MLTDVEQKAVEGSTLGGKSEAEDGNDEYQVAGMIGEIIKVNQVKCKVKFDGGTR